MKKMKSLRKMHHTIKRINICKIEYQKKREISKKKKKNQRNNRTLPNLLKTKNPYNRKLKKLQAGWTQRPTSTHTVVTQSQSQHQCWDPQHTHCSNTVRVNINAETHKHTDCCKAKSESTSILRLTTWSLSWTQQVQGSVVLKTVFTEVTSLTSGAHLTCTSDQRDINSEGGERGASCSLPVNSESACLPLSLTHTSTCSPTIKLYWVFTGISFCWHDWLNHWLCERTQSLALSIPWGWHGWKPQTSIPMSSLWYQNQAPSLC